MNQNQEPTPDEIKEWIGRRVNAVESVYTAYTALSELGIEIPDEHTTCQINCVIPAHGPDARPSARYYAPEGNKRGHFYCFKCKEQLKGIGIFARTKNIKFMDALAELERRFSIKIPRKPDQPQYKDQAARSNEYVSDQWSDVPRMLVMLEGKLKRLRSGCGMVDYIKFCRLLDAVDYDYNKLGKSNPDQINALNQLREKMDKVRNLQEISSLDDPNPTS